MTTKPWSIEEAIDNYAEAGVAGITVWRQWLADRDIETVGDRIRNCGLDVVSLCRGGFFPASESRGLEIAIEDNRLAGCAPHRSRLRCRPGTAAENVSPADRGRECCSPSPRGRA